MNKDASELRGDTFIKLADIVNLYIYGYFPADTNCNRGDVFVLLM